MRILVPSLLTLLLACGPAEPTPILEVKSVSGHVRYQQGNQSLQADLLLPDSTDRVPSFLGSAMEPIGQLPTDRFRHYATGDLPSVLRFGVDADGETTATFSFVSHPIYVDSLPDTLYRSEAVNFPVADRGLTEVESLVLFFEPTDRSTPKRILVTGPTATGTVSLPTSAIDDIAPGEYEVYIVKQRLFKDQIRTVKASIQTEFFTRSAPVTVQ
ncbi:hypothetical protein [Neolewinella litorea]|uniref:Uncharacterized protein n=1 Tax=Neolewinella litorea TaxID=2562452 RepID=A0A4S4NMS7_9BACT|nr:hypothetical protein [Neolewinella litorea]THH41122.1 hypothetical protein E4021_00570 [Neolewinella litorea]